MNTIYYKTVGQWEKVWTTAWEVYTGGIGLPQGRRWYLLVDRHTASINVTFHLHRCKSGRHGTPKINFVKFGDIKRSLGSSVLRQDVDASVFIRYSTDNGNFDAQCGITEYHNAHSSKVLYWNYHSQATVRNATFVLVGNQPRSGCADEVINVAVVWRHARLLYDCSVVHGVVHNAPAVVTSATHHAFSAIM